MNEANNGYLNFENYYNTFQFSDLPVAINDALQCNYNNVIQDDLSDQIPASLNNNFPFVQIHTINAQPTNNNFGNIFRRNQSNNEIKSEPIKSEQNDGNQNHVNVQSNTNCGPASRRGNINENVELINSKHLQKRCSLASCSKNSKQTDNIKIFKCKQCLFLSTSENILNKHYSNEHINAYNSVDCGSSEKSGAKRCHVTCPGCDNIFYAKNSMKAHLEFDHMMLEEEVKLVIRNIFKECDVDQQKKSRIYLKNVECLIEPRSDQVEQNCDSNNYQPIFNNNNSSLIDIINCESDIGGELVTTSNIQPSLTSTSNKMKQKISIKSVDVLCEPSFVQKDNNNFNNIYDIDQLCYVNDAFSDSLYNNQATIDSAFQNEKVVEKSNRPKIYIKNVDILKEPIFLPPNNVNNILNANNELHFNMFQMPTLPSVASSDELRTSFNTTPNEQQNSFESTSTPDGFSYNEPNHFHSDDTSYKNENTFQSNNNFIEKPKKKIFIKNASEILKPLGDYDDSISIPKRTTNYIHLRTVDELNLMNKKEVQNLITPNLDPVSTTPDTIHNSSDNSKNSDSGGMCGNFSMLSEINVFGEKTERYTELERPRENNWSNDFFFDGLENIIESSLSPVCGDHKNSHFDLNTPQVITSTIHDADQESDSEILFVCAQELINANQENSSEKTSKSDTDLDSNTNVLPPVETESESNNILGKISESQTAEPETSNSLSPNNHLVHPSEKGRIYVADNLMAEKNKDEELITGKKSNRGRPIGSNRNSTPRAKKILGNSAEIDLDIKCNLVGCSFRFKKPETLEYHKKCHTSGPQRMKCPECDFSNFSSWNTLHTHLWRSHKIDMELYSCDRCNFKTPIYSRLANTHSKIHSDERNYKCDQCEKAFKNSKQLKNHRRYHRTTTTPSNEIHKCSVCGLAFSHIRSLKEHTCKENDEAKQKFQCKICEKVLSSKSALKLHALTHEIASKFKCESCDYVTNDHNAFRRHKMTHDSNKMYQCPHCDYKSIQSTTYQHHIQQKHPDSANFIILKCNFCSFSTINRALFNVHLAKHDNRPSGSDSTGTTPIVDTECNEQSLKVCNNSEQTSNTITMTATPVMSTIISESTADQQINNNSRAETDDKQPKNKIQVKRDLVLTDFSNVSNAIVLQNFNDSIN